MQTAMAYERADVLVERACSGFGMFVKPDTEQGPTEIPLVDGKGLSFLGNEQVQIGPPPISEEEKERRREIRLANCGKFLGRNVREGNGSLRRFPSYCKLWRDKKCPPCFQRRLDWLQGRILHAIVKFKEEGGLRALLSDYNGVREAASGLDKSDYFRLPIDDDEVILFVRGNKSNVGAEITYEDVIKMDWPKYINTPKGKRVSGSLGRDHGEGEGDNMSKGKKSKKVAVNTPVIAVGGLTSEEELEAWGRALRETADLDPHTKEELEDALWKRTRAFIKAIEEAGGYLLGDPGHEVGIQKHYIDLTGMAWKRPYPLNMEEARFELEKGEGIPF